MEIVIGYAKSDSQISVTQIDTQTQNLINKIIDSDHINETPLNFLISPESEWIEGYNLKNELGLYPILNNQNLGLNLDQFEHLSATELTDLYKKQIHFWTLRNNLNTLENFYSLSNHLRTLWNGDRISFFEELWTLLKKNLGTSELTILFNDIEEIQKEDATTQKLIKSVITGQKTYQIRNATEQETAVLEHYNGKFSEKFELETLDLSKNQMVGLVQVDNSPLIIMAKVSSFTEIQRSLLKGIFNALNS